MCAVGVVAGSGLAGLHLLCWPPVGAGLSCCIVPMLFQGNGHHSVTCSYAGACGVGLAVQSALILNMRLCFSLMAGTVALGLFCACVVLKGGQA